MSASSASPVDAVDPVDPVDAVDPRGQRFAAAVTSLVLAAVVVTQSGWLLALQTVVFAVGAAFGVRRSPYSLLFARVLRPRLGPPAHTEAPQPPRFAQAVGLAFAAVGLFGFVAGPTALGLVATGLAFAAAFLNAAFGVCLGCELYLLAKRFSRNSVNKKDNDRATTPTEVQHES